MSYAGTQKITCYFHCIGLKSIIIDSEEVKPLAESYKDILEFAKTQIQPKPFRVLALVPKQVNV